MATSEATPTIVLTIAISIHTTLAGGDFHAFNISIKPFISIHTTLAGGDGRAGSRQAPAGMISIHTTLAGGD